MVEISIYPTHYYVNSRLFTIFTVLFSVMTFGHLGIQYFIKRRQPSMGSSYMCIMYLHHTKTYEISQITHTVCLFQFWIIVYAFILIYVSYTFSLHDIQPMFFFTRIQKHKYQLFIFVVIKFGIIFGCTCSVCIIICSSWCYNFANLTTRINPPCDTSTILLCQIAAIALNPVIYITYLIYFFLNIISLFPSSRITVFLLTYFC